MPGRPRFCTLKCKGDFQRRAKPVTREWLEQKYVQEGMDCVQIAALVSRDPKSVWNWMKDFGIPTRPRGGATSPHAFVKGAPNLFAGRKHTPETRARLKAISIADGRTPHPANGIPWMLGRRGAEVPAWKGGVSTERQAFYSSLEWKAACKATWQRANAMCERCGADHRKAVRGTFHVHHIVSFAVVEKRADPANLALLCRQCHLFVHSKKNVNGEFTKGIQ